MRRRPTARISRIGMSLPGRSPASWASTGFRTGTRTARRWLRRYRRGVRIPMSRRRWNDCGPAVSSSSSPTPTTTSLPATWPDRGTDRLRLHRAAGGRVQAVSGHLRLRLADPGLRQGGDPARGPGVRVRHHPGHSDGMGAGLDQSLRQAKRYLVRPVPRTAGPLRIAGPARRIGRRRGTMPRSSAP